MRTAVKLKSVVADKPRPYLQRVRPGVTYFRFEKRSIEQLPGADGEKDFEAAYARLCAWAVVEKGKKTSRPRGRKAAMLNSGAQAAPQMIERTATGRVIHHAPAIGWVAQQWFATNRFVPESDPRFLRISPKKGGSYAESTQAMYRDAVDHMVKDEMADMSILKLMPAGAKDYIADVKDECGGSVAARQKTVLANLWEFAASHKSCRSFSTPLKNMVNPMLAVDYPYETEHEHRPWPDDVRVAFLDHCAKIESENIALAYYLLICTGQRISDVIKMKWSDIYVDRESGESMMRVIQKKDRTREVINIKITKLLAAALAEVKRVSPTILTNTQGRAYSRHALWQRIKGVLRIVAPNGQVSAKGLPCSDYTVHGLRKNCGIALALNKASLFAIMAQLGHKTEKMALYYVRLANKITLALQAGEHLDNAFADEFLARVKRRRAALKIA